jgi:hypothetical protein
VHSRLERRANTQKGEEPFEKSIYRKDQEVRDDARSLFFW